jgi:hypothetical protein
MASKKRAPNALACVLLAAAGTGFGQTPPPDIASLVSGARLGSGYAQMIGLAATPDISAASYEIQSSNPKPKLDVFRAPYQAKWLALSPNADLYWKAAGGYMRYKDDFPTTSAAGESGTVGSRWTGYSVGGGLLAKLRLGNGFTLEPALDIAVARLENSADYSGAAAPLQPLFDGLLFNWQTDAWLITPSIGLDWSHPIGDAKLAIRGHVARSWIQSFGESTSFQSFSEATNAYSIRADYAQPTSYRIADRALSWVAYGGYAGFFGANRDALGFDAVAKVGGGFELPLHTDRPNSDRVRLAAGYLFGPDVRGWTIGLSLEY